MSGRSVVLAILLGAGSVAGALYLLGAQFADGGAYPAYSSLRSDSLGAKLLFDTLALVPGTSVARNYLPLEYLKGSDAAVLLLDMNLEALDAEQLGRMDELAARGNRVVAAATEGLAMPTNTGPLAKTWHVRIGFDPHAAREKKVFFSESKGWRTIRVLQGEQDELRPIAVERASGKGSVVLLADSSDFANEALVKTGADSFPPISTAIGSYSRVIFDEQHFGITQTGSVAGLVRCFRLTGMVLGFAICAALLVWRNVTAFPPPGPAGETVNLSGRTSSSGLLTLLRRHVAPSELASVCWNEWLTVNRRGLRPEGLARAERAIRTAGDEPVKAIREIQSILNSKGTL